MISISSSASTGVAGQAARRTTAPLRATAMPGCSRVEVEQAKEVGQGEARRDLAGVAVDGDRDEDVGGHRGGVSRETRGGGLRAETLRGERGQPIGGFVVGAPRPSSMASSEAASSSAVTGASRMPWR